MTTRPLDLLARPLRDLRVSLTDRCNFRCTYCMPKDAFGPEFRFLPRREILTFEEIVRVTSAARELGVRKIRLTGGEPLLRQEVPLLVSMLAEHRDLDLTLTTNGSLLAAQAGALARAGLRRINVSLDSLDDAVFRAMNDVGFPVARVLAGITAALEAGLGPVKVNCVVRRGVNDHTVLDLAEHFRGTGIVVRFIEYMDVGNANGWRLDEVVTARELRALIDAKWPLEPLDAGVPGEVAERWRYRDGGGEIGLISSVSQPFCGSCTRLRLSADGHLFTCLFASAGTDLRPALRQGRSGSLDALLSSIWRHREDRYSELRTAATAHPVKAEMSYLGG